MQAKTLATLFGGSHGKVRLKSVYLNLKEIYRKLTKRTNKTFVQKVGPLDCLPTQQQVNLILAYFLLARVGVVGTIWRRCKD